MATTETLVVVTPAPLTPAQEKAIGALGAEIKATHQHIKRHAQLAIAF